MTSKQEQEAKEIAEKELSRFSVAVTKVTTWISLGMIAFAIVPCVSGFCAYCWHWWAGAFEFIAR